MGPFYLEARPTGANSKAECSRTLFHDLYGSVSGIWKNRTHDTACRPSAWLYPSLAPSHVRWLTLIYRPLNRTVAADGRGYLNVKCPSLHRSGTAFYCSSINRWRSLPVWPMKVNQLHLEHKMSIESTGFDSLRASQLSVYLFFNHASPFCKCWILSAFPNFLTSDATQSTKIRKYRTMNQGSVSQPECRGISWRFRQASQNKYIQTLKRQKFHLSLETSREIWSANWKYWSRLLVLLTSCFYFLACWSVYRQRGSSRYETSFFGFHHAKC